MVWYRYMSDVDLVLSISNALRTTFTLVSSFPLYVHLLHFSFILSHFPGRTVQVKAILEICNVLVYKKSVVHSGFFTHVPVNHYCVACATLSIHIQILSGVLLHVLGTEANQTHK